MRHTFVLLTWILLTFSGCASQAVKQTGQVTHDLSKKIHTQVSRGTLPDVEDTGDMQDGARVLRTQVGEPDEPIDIKDTAKRKAAISQGQKDAEKGILGAAADYIDSNPISSSIFGFLGLGSVATAVGYGLRKLAQYRGLLRKTIGVVHRLPPTVQEVIRGGMKDALNPKQRVVMSRFVTHEKVLDADRPAASKLEILSVENKTIEG